MRLPHIVADNEIFMRFKDAVNTHLAETEDIYNG